MWGPSAGSTYPPEVQSWEDLDNTCDNLGHSHHRTAAGPTETRHGQSDDPGGQKDKKYQRTTTTGGLRATRHTYDNFQNDRKKSFNQKQGACD